MEFQIPALQNPLEPEFGRDKPWLAPMAGYSDLPFRLLCGELGAAACETEMISAKGLCHASSGTERLLENSIFEKPLIVQLFGSDPETTGQAAAMLRRAGWLWFDFNLGCPAKKVLRQGSGAALLERPEKAAEIGAALLKSVKACQEDWRHSTIRAKAGFKLRPGLKRGKRTGLEIALRLQDLGASWITIHPRFAEDGYQGQADWEETARFAEALDIPVIASGDILNEEKSAECLEKTGAAGVMFARGALHDPLVFKWHGRIMNGESLAARTKSDLIKIIERHIELTRKFQGDKRAFCKIRSFMPRYVRNFPGVGELRKTLCSCGDWDALSRALNKFVSNLPLQDMRGNME